jgi:hypothetical protein
MKVGRTKRSEVPALLVQPPGTALCWFGLPVAELVRVLNGPEFSRIRLRGASTRNVR